MESLETQSSSCRTSSSMASLPWVIYGGMPRGWEGLCGAWRSQAEVLSVLNYLLSSKHLDMPGRWYDVEQVLRKLRSDGRLPCV